MTIWLAIIYGIIQGATEFLPVSSSGHLVLLNNIVGTECNLVFFSLLLHLATLLAVLITLRKEIWFLLKNPFGKRAFQLYYATIPTVLIVFLFMDFFKNAFLGIYLPVCFMTTALLLTITELMKKTTKPFTIKSGVIMGIAQSIAVLPGISRSGATICAGLLCGAERKEVTKFSFLMSVPIILASMAYEIFDCVKNGTPLIDLPFSPTIIAFVCAFIVGILCIKFMIYILPKIKLWWFSIYLILISIISFIWL